MSILLERRLSKDQILELYSNDVALGQRGSFAIHGVAEAARLFFAKDITNVSLTEAATIAGVIQSPSRLSPFNNGDRAKERRNVVLRTMVESGFISDDAATRTSKEPLLMAARALESEAPYFVDFISQELQDKYKSLGTVDVYTTLDLHLQRLAQDSHRDGLTRVDELLKRRRRRAEAALIAVDPRNGEVLAFVGGRSYNQSQYNRRRQRAAPAGLGLQAVRLSGGIRARLRRRPNRCHSGDAGSRRTNVVHLQRTDLVARTTTRVNTTARSRFAVHWRSPETSRR